MRRGIGLRGYAQQDPLNEFKREAFQLYDELRGLIRHGVAIVDLPGDRHPPAAHRATAATRRSAASLARGAAALAPATGQAAANGRATARPARRRDRRRHGGREGPGSGRGAVARPSCAADRPLRRPPDRCANRSAIEPVTRGGGRRVGPGGPKPGFTPSGDADRAQRSVLVRFGREVQEVPRALSRGAATARPNRPR